MTACLSQSACSSLRHWLSPTPRCAPRTPLSVLADRMPEVGATTFRGSSDPAGTQVGRAELLLIKRAG